MYEPRIVIVKQIPARQTTGSIKNYCAPAGEINTSDREISLYCRNAAGEKKTPNRFREIQMKIPPCHFFSTYVLDDAPPTERVAQIAYNQEIDGVELLVDNRPSPFGSPLLSR